MTDGAPTPGAIAKGPLFELLFGAVDEAVVGRLATWLRSVAVMDWRWGG